MKKMKKSVKIVLIASVSLICVAAIVLGCIFGFKKEGGDNPPTVQNKFTAAQKLLANEINDGTLKMDYSIYDAVPYASVCSYNQLTMLGKNYFAYESNDSHEEFYTYKINEDGSIDINHITDPAKGYIDIVSGTETYGVSAIKENYVVLKTTYKNADEQNPFTQEKYTLLYFGDFDKPTEIFSYSTKDKDVWCPTGLELKDNYYILPAISNCDIENGTGDFELHYNFYTTEKKEESPTQVLVSKYYYSGKTFEYETNSNMFFVQSDNVLKIVYLKSGVFETVEKTIEKKNTGELLYQYEINELTDNKFMITKVIPVTSNENVTSSSVILDGNGDSNAYVNYEYYIYDSKPQVAIETKLSMENGYAAVSVPKRDVNLNTSFYIGFQKVENNTLQEKYLVCYYDDNLNQIVKYESNSNDKIEQVGSATFVTASQILKANEKTKVSSSFKFSAETYSNESRITEYATDYIIINKNVNDTNIYGLMDLNGQVVVKPEDVKFIKIFDIVGDNCFVTDNSQQYYQYNIKTKEKTLISDYEYDKVVTSKNLGLYVVNEGDTKSISSINDGLIVEDIASFVGNQDTATTVQGGVYFELKLEDSTKFMLYYAKNKDYSNNYTTFANAPSTNPELDFVEAQQDAEIYGSSSYNLQLNGSTVGTGSFSQSQNPKMTITMNTSYYLYDVSIKLKFFNEYTLSISGLGWTPAESSNYTVGYSYSGDLVTAPYAYMSNCNIVYYCQFSYTNIFGYGGTGFEGVSGTLSQAYFYVFICYLEPGTEYSTTSNRVNTYTNISLGSTLIHNQKVEITLPSTGYDLKYGHLAYWRMYMEPTDSTGSTYYYRNYFDPSVYKNDNTIEGLDYNWNFTLSKGYKFEHKVSFALYAFIYAYYEVNKFTIYEYDENETYLGYQQYSVKAYAGPYYYQPDKTGYTWDSFYIWGADSSLTHSVDHMDDYYSVISEENLTGSSFNIYPKSNSVMFDIQWLEQNNGEYCNIKPVYNPIVYTITLNKQSGSGGSSYIYEHYGVGCYLESALTNKMTTSANKITVPSRTGYTFGGYYSSTGGSGTQYITSSGYLSAAWSTAWSKNSTIYAKWTPKTYTVKYYTSPTTTTTTTVSYDNVVNIPGISKDFYQFNGYSISGCDSCTHYYGTTSSANSGNTTNTSFTVSAGYYYFKNLRSSSGTVTITPRWVANTYTVTYDANNGYFSDSTQTKSITASYDSSYTIPTVTRTGYTYGGWTVSGMDTDTTHYFYYSSSNTTSTASSITLSTAYTSYMNLRGSSGTVTFVARWTANTYTISYDLGAGSWSGTETHPTSATYDQVFYLDNVFESEESWPFGYYFNGWTISGLYGNYYRGSTSSVSKVTTNYSNGSATVATSYKYFKNLTNVNGGAVKFTAVWQPYSYNLEYIANGYKAVLSSSSATLAYYDSNFNAYHPSRIGYTFTGWALSGMADEIVHTGNGTTFESSTGIYTEANNPNKHVLFKNTSATYTTFKNLHYVQGSTVTLTAYWTPNTYTITYHYITNDTFSGVPSLAQVNTTSYQTATKTQSVQYDQYFTTYRSSANPTVAEEVGFPTGYGMIGWYLSASTISNSNVTTLDSSHIVGTNAECYFDYTLANTHASTATTMNNLHAYAIYSSVVFTIVYYAPSAQSNVNNLSTYTYYSTETVAYGTVYTFPRTRGSVTFTSYMLSPNLYYKGTLKDSITAYTFNGATYYMAAGAAVTLGIDNAFAHDPDNPVFYLYGVYDADFDGSMTKLSISYLNSSGYQVTDCTSPAGNVVIPKMYNDGTHGPLPIVSIGSYAFSGINIDSVSIPSTVTSIGSYAFYQALSFEAHLTIPDSVTSIGSYAFAETAIPSITLSAGITTISTYTFYYCTSLTKLVIPSSVTTINNNAFGYCTALNSVYIPESVTSISAASKGYSPFYGAKSGCVVYTRHLEKPSGWNSYWNYIASSYTTATYWNKTLVDYKSSYGSSGISVASTETTQAYDVTYLNHAVMPSMISKKTDY